MNIVQLFLMQGILGILCPLVFLALVIGASILGAVRSKVAGYTCLAAAWTVGAGFVAVVAHNMLSASRMEGVAAQSMFFANLSTIFVICHAVAMASIVVVVILSACRFSKRHVAAEILVIVVLLLVVLTIRWYMGAISGIAAQPCPM